MAEDFNPEDFAKFKEAFDPSEFAAFKEEKTHSFWEHAVDVAKQFPSGIARGAAALAPIGEAQLAAENLTDLPAPKVEDYAAATKEALPEPIGMPGRIASAAGETVPLALATGVPTPANLAIQGIAGAGGQAAVEATKGTFPEWLARGVGAVGTGFGAAVLPRAGMAAARQMGLVGPKLPEINAELARALVRDNDTVPAALQRLEEVRAIRPDASLADVLGENGKAIVERLAQTPGAGLSVVRPNLTGQQKAQLGRISNDLLELTGTKRSAFRAAEDTLAEMKEAATPAYKKAYAEGDKEIWSPYLERLTSAPVIQKAMHEAVTNWRNEQVRDGFGAMNPGAIVDRGGLLTFTGGQVPVFPNVQFWDYTKRAMDRMVQAATSPDGKKPGMLVDLTKQLRDAIDGAAPESYAEARAIWSGGSSYLNAIEAGKDVLNRNVTSEELVHNFSSLSPAEQDGFRIGAVSDIIRRMRANPAKLPDLTRDLRSPDVRSKIDAIMPTPEAAQRFNQALDYEIGSSELTRRMGGTQTAFRRAAQEESENIKGELAASLLAHSHYPLARRVILGLSKPVRDTLRSRSDRLLGELLTTPGQDISKIAPRLAPRQPGVIGPAAEEAARAAGISLGYAHGGGVPTKHRVSIKFDVRSGAVASKNHPGLVYIDRHIPKKFWSHLVVHELKEREAMARGASYEDAHKEATAAERADVQRAKKTWAHYTHEIDGYLNHIEHRKVKNPPPDPHVDIDKAVGHHRANNK